MVPSFSKGGEWGWKTESRSDQTRPEKFLHDVMEVCHLLHKTIAILLHCTLGPQTPAPVSLSVLV